MKRAKNWQEDLSLKLRGDKEYRSLFLMSLIEDEGYDVTEAILKLVQLIGVKEYADMIKMDQGNLIKQLNGNPTLKTLEKILSPLEVKMTFKMVS